MVMVSIIGIRGCMERDSQFSVYVSNDGKYFLVYEDLSMWMLYNSPNDGEWGASKRVMNKNVIDINSLTPLEIEGTFDECYDALRLYLLMNS